MMKNAVHGDLPIPVTVLHPPPTYHHLNCNQCVHSLPIFRLAYVEMSPDHSSDIDTPLDWEEVEQRIMKYGYHGKSNKDYVKMLVINVDKSLLDEQVFITGDGS